MRIDIYFSVVEIIIEVLVVCQKLIVIVIEQI